MMNDIIVQRFNADIHERAKYLKCSIVDSKLWPIGESAAAKLCLHFLLEDNLVKPGIRTRNDL